MADASSSLRPLLGLAGGLVAAWVASCVLASEPPVPQRRLVTGDGAAAPAAPAPSAAVAAPSRGRKAPPYQAGPVAAGGTLRVTCRLARPLEAQTLRLNKDLGAGKCGHESLPNEHAVIDPATLGVANCVVHLPGIAAGKPFDGELAEPERVVTVDQQGCVYRPHVMLVREGSRLAIRNSDPVQHNVKGFLNNKAVPRFNVMSSSGSLLPPSDDTALDRAGTYLLFCDIHLWMTGYIRAVSHPYHALTGTDGVAVLTDVPAGPVQVGCWHEGMKLAVQASGPDVTGYAWSPDFEETPQTVTVPAGGTVEVTFLIEPR